MRCDVLVLGPVLVAGAGADRPSSPLTRTVIGLLAVAGDAGLSAAAIADAVWGLDTVPLSRLNVAIHRTRDWLDRHTSGRVRIDRTTTGYALRGAVVDAQHFTDLLRGTPTQADLASALALWRGAPLADVVVLGSVESLVAPLRERHRTAVLGHARILLGSRHVTEAVSLLTPLADDAPMDEMVHALLLGALAASGRQAEALTRYEALRRRLADQLGVDPGPELSGAMVQVLRGELPYGGTGAAPGEPAPTMSRPAQLTPDVTSFTGRASQLGALDALVDTPRRGPRVALVTGVGGVGKTALAVYWAHGRANDFPDGQLHIDLRGYSHGRAVTAADALGRFLRGLGVAPAALPADLDESATLYRSLTAHRRMLVLLDNAADVAQIRPLLPGDSHAVVLVTSRDRLDGLVVRDGATRVALDVLSPAESLALLGAAVGTARITAEPDAANELAVLCGQLPLALRVVAAHLTAEPDLLIADYVRGLAVDRMSGLAVSGDPTSSVQEVFDQSYLRLDPGTRRMYRLLGLAPVADVTPGAAAALAGVSDAEARTALDTLAAAHLAVDVGGRYGMHDLVGEHARGRSTAEDRSAGVAAALRGLEDWYYDTARVCCLTLWPNLTRLPDDVDPDLPVPADPEGWLDAEAANLAAVLRHAADRGRHDYVWRAMHDTRAVLDFRDSATALLAGARLGLASALAARDWLGVSALAKIVAATCQRTGQMAESPQHYRTAIDAAERADWSQGKVAALNGLAIWHGSGGNLARANDILREVVANCVTPDMRYLRAIAFGNMATAHRLMGDLPAAARHARLSLATYRRVGDAGEGFVPSLLELGVVHYEMGCLEQARTMLLLVRWAPSDSSRLDTRCGSTDWLARVECAAGNLTAAADYATEGARLAEETQDQERLTNAQCTQGLLALALGDPGTALAHFRESAALAVAGSDPAGEAAALIGMGASHNALGDVEQAATHADAALAIGRAHDYRLVECDAHHLLAVTHHDRGATSVALTHARAALATAGASRHRTARAVALLTRMGAATD